MVKPSVLLLAASLASSLVACSPSHFTHYEQHYEVAPRELVWGAIQTVRAMHYSIVGIESWDPQHEHTEFLAFADDAPSNAPNALRVMIAPGVAPDTLVDVTPLAYRGGKLVSSDQVPAQTRADAVRLAEAIERGNRARRAYRI